MSGNSEKKTSLRLSGSFPSQPEEDMVLPHAHLIDTPLRVTARHAPRSGKECWKQKCCVLSQNANVAFDNDETEQKEEKTVIRKGQIRGF